MLGKTFGKRVHSPSSAATLNYAPAGADPDGVTRVLSKALWDGPRGEMLRKAGLTPDDPQNLALTPDRARAKMDAATRQMDTYVAKVNAHIPGVRVAPWAILPWSVWQGVNAEFLIKADFLPSSPWNNMLLADDSKSSVFLGLPEHPRKPIPGIEQDVTRLVDELRIAFKVEHDKIFAELTQGNFSALDTFEKLKTDRFQKLFALMRYLMQTVFGKAICDRHDELFGIGLKGVTG